MTAFAGDPQGQLTELDAPLLDHLPLAVLARRMDGVIVYANVGATILFERRLDELLGARLLDFCHRDDTEEAARVAGLSTTRHAVELRIVTGSGAVRWVRSSRHRSTLDGEDVWVVAMHDITIEKAAQHDLEASQAQLVAVLNAVGDGIIHYDANRRIVTANCAAAALARVSDPDDLVGVDLPAGLDAITATGERFAVDDLPVSRCLASGQPVGPVLVGWDQGAQWRLVSAFPLQLPGEDRAGCVSWFRDVTEELRSQEALTASESRHRSVVEALREGLVVQSADGTVVSANRAAETMLGLSLDQLCGRAPIDPRWAITDERGNPFTSGRDLGAMALRTGLPVHDVVLGVVHASGERRWIRGSVSPLSVPGFSGVFSVFTDITDSLRVEQALADSESQFRLLTEHANDIVVSVDSSSRLLYASPSVASLGYRSVDGLGRDAMSFVADDDRSRLYTIQQTIFRGTATDDSGRSEVRLVAADGRMRWFDVQVVGLRDPQGNVHRVNYFARDVHDHRIAEAALARSEAQFRLVAGQAAMGIFTSRLDGLLDYVNEAYCRIMGTSGAAELGRHWLHSVHPDDVGLVRRSWDATFAAGAEGTFEFRIVRPDAETRTVLVTATKFLGADGEWHYLGTAADISDQRANERRLSHDATHDPLTDLPNRVLLGEMLDHALSVAQRTNELIALLFIDLDHFKPVNDTHGHAAGDRVLVQVASRLTAAIRGSDTAARFGGDEFVVVLDAPVTPEEAVAIAQRILADLHRPFEVVDQLIDVGASIGVAVAWTEATAAQLLDAADRAVYDAKRAGGGVVAKAPRD
ncbi:MAG: PAS domain S-box protein [Actinomycetota bacterium]|nr:PAS domain S-box protein [Actinomycetota bacterium]